MDEQHDDVATKIHETEEQSDIARTNSGKRCVIFSSAKWALVFFSSATMLQQLVINGLFSVVVSTLERRFELTSTETGAIASVFGLAASVMTIFILFMSEDVHKARWFSRGTCLVGFGVLLFAMPHFLAPIYTISETDNFNYCGNVTEPECNRTSGIREYRYVFSLSVALMGAGSCFQHAYGISYLDENVSKDNSALFNSIFFAITGFGAAIGFVAGGFSLNCYTYIAMSKDDIGVDNTSDLWVGAWWLCYIFTGAATLLIAIPLHMYPRYLPGTEKHRENRNAEMQKVKSNYSQETKSFSRKKSDFMFLLRNKPYVLITLASAVNCALIFGFNTFGAKYMETVFGTTPFQASLIYGACVVVASLTGQLAGGYFIKRKSLDVKGIIKFIIVGGVFSAVCSFGFLIHCTDANIAGATTPYPKSNVTEEGPSSQCNTGCGCSLDKYDPVCSGDVIYFSPCYAGCTEQYNKTTFGSCSCVQDEGFVSTQGCDRNSCNSIYPFVAAIFFCFFSSVLTISPSIQITLRCVPFDKRILALSMQRLVILMLGVVPGRLLVGYVMDLSCVSWGSHCGQKGSCHAYKRWSLAKNNTILLVSQTVICAIIYVFVYITYKPAERKVLATDENVESYTVDHSSHTDENGRYVDSQKQSQSLLADSARNQ